MRKSTTLARMMKNRNRGIPKPLFQSVQFPTLITTSSTLYQVQTHLCIFADPRQISESFSVLHAHYTSLHWELIIELTTWKPNDHAGVITVKHHMIKLVVEKCTGLSHTYIDQCFNHNFMCKGFSHGLTTLYNSLVWKKICVNCTCWDRLSWL